MKRIDEIVDEYFKKGVFPFENFETYNPFGTGIYTTDRTLAGRNTRIGLISYNPINSSGEALVLSHPKGKWSHAVETPNLFLTDILSFLHNNGDPVPAEEVLEKSAVLLPNNKFKEYVKRKARVSGETISVETLIREVQEYLPNTCPKSKLVREAPSLSASLWFSPTTCKRGRAGFP